LWIAFWNCSILCTSSENSPRLNIRNLSRGLLTLAGNPECCTFGFLAHDGTFAENTSA
jgi:hypothetical protein